MSDPFNLGQSEGQVVSSSEVSNDDSNSDTKEGACKVVLCHDYMRKIHLIFGYKIG